MTIKTKLIPYKEFAEMHKPDSVHITVPAVDGTISYSCILLEGVAYTGDYTQSVLGAQRHPHGQIVEEFEL